MSTDKQVPLTWICRFHPTDSWHEVGCPHLDWDKEQLQAAIESQKRNQPEIARKWVEDLQKEIAAHAETREQLTDAERLAIRWRDKYDGAACQVAEIINEWQEKEAACCPEDVGFPEYIAALEKERDALKEQLAQAQSELDRATRIRRDSRIYCHVPPDPIAIEKNREIEPDGERLREELTNWLERNGIVSMMLDTPKHYVDVGITKLPPRIHPVLRLWGSIYTIDDAALRAKQGPPQHALRPAEGSAEDTVPFAGGREL